VFENKELRNLLDIKIFVDTDADVRVLRRIKRDVKDRGRTFDSVYNQYMKTVRPMHLGVRGTLQKNMPISLSPKVA